MVKIHADYRGTLRCEAQHEPSSCKLITDAPVDNCGKGESFSPTDLVATALGTCMLTILGVVCDRRGWKLERASADVEKHMIADPIRRIERLEAVVRIAGDFDAPAREALEEAAVTCPVHKSVSPGIDIQVSFEWLGAKVGS